VIDQLEAQIETYISTFANLKSAYNLIRKRSKEIDLLKGIYKHDPVLVLYAAGVLEQLDKNFDTALLSLSPGTGKSLIAQLLLDYYVQLNKKVAVVTLDDGLVEQYREYFESAQLKGITATTYDDQDFDLTAYDFIVFDEYYDCLRGAKLKI
jgi:superfamily II DNA or RNA helicase